MQKLSNLHQKLGGLQNQVKNEEAKIQSLMYRRDEVERRLSQLNESQRDRQADWRRAQLVVEVQSVLDAYSGQLTYAKVEELKTTVVDCFNQLCRKHGLLKGVTPILYLEISPIL